MIKLEIYVDFISMIEEVMRKFFTLVGRIESLICR